MASSLAAGTVSQTFEDGEDTTDWGSSWTLPNGGTYTTDSPTFLDQSLGGDNAGYGSDFNGKNASREFSNNTAGLDLNERYRISLYTQLDYTAAIGASQGRFEIYNGGSGQGSTFGSVRLVSDGTGSGVLEWQAYDHSGSGDWVDFGPSGITMTSGQIFYVQFDLNPSVATYDVLVSRVNSDGSIIESGSLVGLEGSPGNINQHQGTLGFDVADSSGTASFKVDNINITNVPEPQAFALLAGLGVFVLSVVRRRSR